MNLNRILSGLPSRISKADARQLERRKKDGRPAGMQMLGERLVRSGDYEIRFLTFLAFRAIHWEIMTKKLYAFETENPEPFIVDGGANIGLATLYFKQCYPRARILAFEPTADASGCFEENIKRNRLENVVLHKAAVGNQTGEITFFMNDTEVGNLLTSIVHENDSDREVTLPCVKLSDYLDEPVDFLKLDIEGSEMAVLEDLESSGKLSLVQKMGIEYHHHMRPGVDEMGRFLSILERGGFGYDLKFPEYGDKVQREMESVIINAYRKVPA